MSASTQAAVIRTLEVAPPWRPVLEHAVGQLRACGPRGERLVGWLVGEFRAGRVQQAFEPVHDPAVAAAELAGVVVSIAAHLQFLAERHRPLPDYRSFKWAELLEWRDAIAEEVEREAAGRWERREVALEFTDGWTVELVTTERDLQREAAFMRNCVDSEVDLEAGQLLLSLRDPQGRPHLDVLLDPIGDVVDLRGRCDQMHPRPEYLSRLRAFFGLFERPCWSDDRDAFFLAPWVGRDEFGLYDPRTLPGALRDESPLQLLPNVSRDLDLVAAVERANCNREGGS